MKTILIIGASGNVGLAVVHGLYEKYAGQFRIIAALRNPDKEVKVFAAYTDLEYRRFDFEDFASMRNALEGVDMVFLLRPPAIANVKKYFHPLIDAIKEEGIQALMFLSVQGAEKSSIIPHHKIEKYIQQKEIPYIFLRPSYFMQNLTTTLKKDIQEKQEIYLPAGRAKFTWVDVADIGKVAAVLLAEFEDYKNQAVEITGEDQANFETVATILSKHLKHEIKYRSPNLWSFYWRKRKEGMPSAFVFVMIMLHYLPRFQNVAPLSDAVIRLTKDAPKSLDDFIQEHLEEWEK